MFYETKDIQKFTFIGQMVDLWCNCIPRTNVCTGILWFSRHCAAAAGGLPRPQTFHRSHDNLKNPYRIASIFDM